MHPFVACCNSSSCSVGSNGRKDCLTLHLVSGLVGPAAVGNRSEGSSAYPFFASTEVGVLFPSDAGCFQALFLTSEIVLALVPGLAFSGTRTFEDSFGKDSLDMASCSSDLDSIFILAFVSESVKQSFLMIASFRVFVVF